MKKVIFLSTAVIVALIAFTSCGGGNKGVVPAKDTISGPLGAYFKVVDRTYKINDGKINVEIERTNDGLPSPWEEGMEVGYSDNRVEPGFIVEFMDEDGDILCKDQTDIVWERDELVATVSLAIGESTSIPFSANDKKVAKFKVSSTFKYHEPETPTYSSSSSSSSSSTTSSSSNKSILDEVVDDYSSTMKEAKEELQEAYQEAAEELQDAMTSALKDLF